MFDKLIIDHCAPALSGIKIANIFTCEYKYKREVNKKVSLYNNILNKRGINVAVIKYYNNKAVVYVYNKKALKNYLSDDNIFKFLKNYGYKSKNIHESIETLKRRMQYSKTFPHEIGIFLGYPLIDINGFINNYGKNSLYTGYWKVYHNKKEAIKIFDNYNRCRTFYINTFLRGKGILEIMDDYKLHFL